jgi:hypothetical protein
MSAVPTFSALEVLTPEEREIRRMRVRDFIDKVRQVLADFPELAEGEKITKHKREQFEDVYENLHNESDILGSPQYEPYVDFQHRVALVNMMNEFEDRAFSYADASINQGGGGRRRRHKNKKTRKGGNKKKRTTRRR